MISASRSWHGWSRTARLLLVVLAFTGLFAMHGLGDHGTAHEEMSAPAAASSAHDSHGSTVSMPSAADAGEVVSDAPEADGAGMLGLCLAVLAGAVLALAWLRSRTPLTVIRRWPYRSGPNLRATMLRDRDPPCLFELSIQRC